VQDVVDATEYQVTLSGDCSRDIPLQEAPQEGLVNAMLTKYPAIGDPPA